MTAASRESAIERPTKQTEYVYCEQSLGSVSKGGKGVYCRPEGASPYQPSAARWVSVGSKKILSPERAFHSPNRTFFCVPNHVSVGWIQCFAGVQKMARLRMNDKQWQRIRPMIPVGKPGGRPPLNRRTILDGIIWILRTGAPWRDLPEEFGKWQTV